MKSRNALPGCELLFYRKTDLGNAARMRENGRRGRSRKRRRLNCTRRGNGGDLRHSGGGGKTAEKRCFKAFFKKIYPQKRFFSKIFRFSVCIFFIIDYIRQ